MSGSATTTTLPTTSIGGDLGCYGGGENRGAPTPNLDRMAEGLQFMSFYLWNDRGERHDRFMNGWAEKTWAAPQIGALPLSLLPTYKKYPNRTLETAGISAAMFDVEDAKVQQQVQRLLHSLAGNE